MRRNVIRSEKKDVLEFSEERIVLDKAFIPCDVRFEFYANAKEMLLTRPLHLLPLLPSEYKWVKKAGKLPIVMKHRDAANHRLEIVIYGPENNKINYITVVDGNNHFSFAHTKPNSFDPNARRYPMNKERDYSVPGFRYISALFHTPGHCIDHAHTMGVGLLPLSTHDKRNYIPEGPKSYWGLRMRNMLTREFTKNFSDYMQVPYYSETPIKTANGTPVPESIFLSEVNKDEIVQIYNVNASQDFETRRGLRARKLLPSFVSDKLSAPVALSYLEDESDKDRLSLISRLSAVRTSFEKDILKTPSKNLVIRNLTERCAEYEFHTPTNKLALACQASLDQRPLQASRSLKRAEQHLHIIKDFDDGRTLISDEQFKVCRRLFESESPGFEDPHDVQVDFFKSLLDQRSRAEDDLKEPKVKLRAFELKTAGLNVDTPKKNETPVYVAARKAHVSAVKSRS